MSKKNPESKRIRSHFLEAASKMPRLSHWPKRDEPFDYSKSEVVQWLKSQPEFDRWIFDKARNSGAIIFDDQTETWVGSKM